MLQLQLEIRRDLGVHADEGLEHRSIQAQGHDVGAGPYRHGLGPAFQDLRLAEAVPGPQDAQRNLSPVLATFDRPRSTRDEQIERLRRRPLVNDHAPEGKRRRNEAGDDQGASVLGEKLQEGQTFEGGALGRPVARIAIHPRRYRPLRRRRATARASSARA